MYLPLQANLGDKVRFLADTSIGDLRQDYKRKIRPRTSAARKKRVTVAARKKRVTVAARKMRPKQKCYGANKGHYNVTRKFKLCPALRQFVKAEEASRGQIVKSIWDYIKAKNLQCKGRGRVIVPDKRLATIIGEEGKEENAFKMMTYIEKHLHHHEK